MTRPAFVKQFAELTEQDFVAHPVWVAVHGMDEEEDWYDDCDEESFRPWPGSLPVGPEEGMLLVRAQFTLADGTPLGGFITPQSAGKALSLGVVQPQIFTPTGLQSFWGGMFPCPASERASFYKNMDKTENQIFPIAFSADLALASGQVAGTIDGFYALEKGQVRRYR